MIALVLILLVLSFVLLLCAAFGVGLPRTHLGWLGLAVFVLVALLGAAGLH